MDGEMKDLLRRVEALHVLAQEMEREYDCPSAVMAKAVREGMVVPSPAVKQWVEIEEFFEGVRKLATPGRVYEVRQ